MISLEICTRQNVQYAINNSSLELLMNMQKNCIRSLNSRKAKMISLLLITRRIKKEIKNETKNEIKKSNFLILFCINDGIVYS